MTLTTPRLASSPFSPWMPVPPQGDRERKRRILTALGHGGECLAGQDLRVSPESLACYYDYLAAHLELPFIACYPRPADSAQAAADRCEVFELLDPRTAICDEFDGLYCRTRKGRFQVNLPLVELTILPPSRNLQLLEDYEYWFWHWRE